MSELCPAPRVNSKVKLGTCESMLIITKCVQMDSIIVAINNTYMMQKEVDMSISAIMVRNRRASCCDTSFTLCMIEINASNPALLLMIDWFSLVGVVFSA